MATIDCTERASILCGESNHELHKTDSFPISTIASAPNRILHLAEITFPRRTPPAVLTDGKPRDGTSSLRGSSGALAFAAAFTHAVRHFHACLEARIRIFLQRTLHNVLESGWDVRSQKAHVGRRLIGDLEHQARK